MAEKEDFFSDDDALSFDNDNEASSLSLSNETSSLDNEHHEEYNEELSASDDTFPDHEFDKPVETEEKKPFLKTQNGMITVASIIGFVCYGGYVFMEQQKPTSQAYTPPPVPVQVAPVNVPVVNPDFGQTQQQVPVVENSRPVNQVQVQQEMAVPANTVLENVVNDSVKQPVEEVVENNDNSGKEVVNSVSNEEVEALKLQVSELNGKIDNLNSALKASYAIISANLEEIKRGSSSGVDGKSFKALEERLEEISKSLSDHRKGVAFQFSKLEPKSVSSSHVKSSPKRIEEKVSFVLIKDRKLTSVVNGTAWVKDMAGNNIRLSVGDKYDSKAVVKSIYADRVVLSDNRFIAK